MALNCSKVVLGITTISIFGLLSCQGATAGPLQGIENLGTIPAEQVRNGLGFNVDGNNETEFRLAAEAGASEVRFQCPWEQVEIQTIDNKSGGYRLPKSCINGLMYSKKYNLHPLVVAAYGPPYHKIVTLVVRSSSSLKAGTYVIPVSASSGSLSNIRFPYSVVKESSGKQIVAESKWSYAGALITGVDSIHKTITLAAKTAIDLPAGTSLDIYELLYPSVAGDSADDPSVIAYAGKSNISTGGYVGFLARSIAAAGLQGRVEIWNEPPWSHDPWDTRYRFYDTNALPRDLPRPAVQFGFAAALMTQSPPPGVRYVWAGTNKSGANSLLGQRMNTKPDQRQIQRSISAESYHPYGNTPEDHAWDPACIVQANDTNWNTCSPPGVNSGSNVKYSAELNLKNTHQFGWAPEMDITEIGAETADQITKARYITRSFLTYLGLGFSKIDFYRLADDGAQFGFVDKKTGNPQAPYYALKSLMAMVNSFSGRPVSPHTAAHLPFVVSYSGQFPLSTVQIAGTKGAGASTNTILYTSWQRSYPKSGSWLTMPSPPPAPVTVSVPAGMQVEGVTDLVTLQKVAYKLDGSRITYSVADNPVGLLLAPS